MFLVLNKVAKGVLAVPGISRVQAITRPEGTPIAHTSIPFYGQHAKRRASCKIMPFQKERMNDMLNAGRRVGENDRPSCSTCTA